MSAAAPGRRHDKRVEKQANNVWAVTFGYIGTAYRGLQWHAKFDTVEGQVEKALLAMGIIKPGGDLESVGWTHASRTDKGVHAVGQCGGIRIVLKNPGPFIEGLNQHLPDDITVFSCRKVGFGFDLYRAFHARLDASSRVYEYLIPSGALTFFDDSSAQSLEAAVAALHSASITDEQVARLDTVLQLYQGRHNWHNFTPDADPGDRASERTIRSFRCGKRRVLSGIEYVSLLVEGDGFLYHQIRKLVGLAVFTLRFCGSPSDVVSAALTHRRYMVPLAPGTGLMLRRVVYTRDNRTHGGSTVLLPLSSDVRRRMKEFRHTRVYPEIASIESAQHVFARWLRMLHATRAAWATELSAWRPEPGSLDALYTSDGDLAEGVGVLEPALDELLRLVDGCGFPELLILFHERARIRRPLNRPFSLRVRAALKRLPGASMDESGRITYVPQKTVPAPAKEVQAPKEVPASKGRSRPEEVTGWSNRFALLGELDDDDELFGAADL